MNSILIISGIVWICAVVHCLYDFYSGIQNRLRPFIGNDLISQGWILKEVDTSDDEWAAFLRLMVTLLPALIAENVLLHIVLDHWRVKTRLVVSFVFLISTFGIKCTIFLYSIFFVTFVLKKHSTKAVYVVNLIVICSSVYCSEIVQYLLGNPLQQSEYLLLFDVAVAWSAVRCVSFGTTAKENDDFWIMLCYFTYLPCFVLGPVINYRPFLRQINKPAPSIEQAFYQAIISILRVCLWIITMEILDHTVFTMATRFDYHLVRAHLTSSEYFGFCVALMGRFYVKYLVIYGVAEEAALVEGIWLPEKPRCTLRITSGADVWRTFDRGLYLWFIETLYVPLGASFLASFSCFLFVCFWHSASPPVLVWCGLNFVLVVAERFASKLSKPVYIMIQCPLHWVAVGSNMFYLGGWDIGVDFFRRLASPQSLMIGFVISLFACVVGRHFKAIDKQYFKRTSLLRKNH